MQRSLEIPLRGFPKAAPWEQWETLKHNNKQAFFVPHGFPLFQAIRSNQFLEYPRNPRVLSSRTRVQEIFQGKPHSSDVGAVLSWRSRLSCLIKFPARHQLRFGRWQAGLRGIQGDPFRVASQATTLSGGH